MPAPRQVPEARLLSFEWPSEMRQGDSDILRLSFVVDEGGRITPTAVFADHQIESQAIEIENLYDTHLVRAEARLDLAGPQVLPSGTQIKRMFPGDPVEFKVDLVPTNHVEHKPYLRLLNLPVNALTNTVLVVKLEFEQAPDETVAVMQDDAVPLSAR